MKRVERIIETNEIVPNDVIILKYAEKEEKYIVQTIDRLGLKAKELFGTTIIRFPLSQLIEHNWYCERNKRA